MKNAIQCNDMSRGNNDAYVSALREFIRGTITDPNFFNMSPMDQKEAAMSAVRKHKAIA